MDKLYYLHIPGVTRLGIKVKNDIPGASCLGITWHYQLNYIIAQWILILTNEYWQYQFGTTYNNIWTLSNDNSRNNKTKGCLSLLEWLLKLQLELNLLNWTLFTVIIDCGSWYEKHMLQNRTRNAKFRGNVNKWS